MKRTHLALAFTLFFSPAFGQTMTGGVTPPAGTNGQIEYNNNGAFGGLTPAIATGCAATGGTIGASLSGTISTSVTITALTGTNPAITAGYCGGLENLSNGSNQIPNIAEAGSAGFAAGWYTDLCNINTGSQTITPSAGTIGGASTYVLAAGTAAAPKCIRIVSDGVSNYVIEASGASGGVTTTGSPSSGNLTKFFGSSSITNGDLTGDCATSGTLATTCNGLVSGPNYSTTRPWYVPLGMANGGGTGSNATGTGRIVCTPGIIPTKLTVGALGFPVKTAGSSNLQLAIYKDASGAPGALIAATANIANTGAGSTVSGNLTATKQVGPGGTDYNGRIVWFCHQVNDATMTGVHDDNFYSGWLIGASVAGRAVNSNSAPPQTLSCTSGCNGGAPAFGTWPDLTSSTWTEDNGSGYPSYYAFSVTSVP